MLDLSYILCCFHCRRQVLTSDASTQTNEDVISEEKEEWKFGESRRHNQRDVGGSSLDTAMQLVQRAIAEDRRHNYQEALSLYQHALVYFLESLNYDSENEQLKSRILSKCRQYLERAEKIADHLCESKRLSSTSSTSTLSDVSRSMSLLTQGETPPLINRNKSTKKSVKKAYQSLIQRKTDTNEDNSKLKRANSTQN